MRHRNKRSKLSVMTAHRKAMMRAMVMNLFRFQRIETTLAKAKESRRLAEHLITIAKEDTVASRRRVYAVIADRDLVKKLFTEIVPLFASRTSGFTRIIHTGFRRGDGADMAILELTEKKLVEKEAKKKKAKAKAEEPKRETAKAEKATAAEKTAAASKEEHKEHAKPKPQPKGKHTPDEEKRREEARSEDKKITDNRGFMKNIRGLFRKRGDF